MLPPTLASLRDTRRSAALAGVAMVLSLAPPAAGDWSQWRGSAADGASAETGLPERWSIAGENLLWRVEFTGRSTPVVVGDRVCATGRAGEGVARQELAACFDAASGSRLWERRWNIYHSTVPWNRLGWASPLADPETGYLYVQGVGGLLFCFDRAGEVVWSRNLLEEYGFMEGYGGRTQTPMLDGDRLIVTFANAGWGEEAAPRHRVRAFDKRTGELLWVATAGGALADANAQSTPVVTVAGGRRLLVYGDGDGSIYALDAASGDTVWSFRLSKRGINTSVVAEAETVYATHSEENVDEPTMGRVVAIDATGHGDVTATHELWRAPLAVGFSSPALAAGRLYLLDNAAMLFALDAATGRALWRLDLGRVGKASPVVADGKLYVTEVNGLVHVVELAADGGAILDTEEIRMPASGGATGRYAEIYGSFAVSEGRLFFATEEGLYAIGQAAAEGRSPGAPEAAPAPAPAVEAEEPGAPARLLVTPAEERIEPGGSVSFSLTVLDPLGRSLPAVPAALGSPVWSLAGLDGVVDPAGVFTADAAAGSQAGTISVQVGELAASARVRVVAALPLHEDFERVAPGERPSYQVGFTGRFEVEEREGSRVLAKNPSPVQIHRHVTFLGAPDQRDYTIEADLLGTQAGRRVPDIGVVNSGYTMELLGAHQELQIRDWPSELRIERRVPFSWQPGVWYRMKLAVDAGGEPAVVRGKVWPRTEPEPEAWTIEVEDPLPIRSGSPGLSAYSPTPVYFDNIRVERNLP